MPIEDLSYKIILNAACSPEKVPEKLKEEGFAKEVIEKITGLSAEEVDAL